MAKAATIRGRGPDSLYRAYLGLDPVPVVSTNVQSVAWDDTLRVLFVRFRSGSLYAYAVPAEVATGMFTAGSKGAFVFDVLRGAGGRRPNRQLDLDRKYEYVQIE